MVVVDRHDICKNRRALCGYGPGKPGCRRFLMLGLSSKQSKAGVQWDYEIKLADFDRNYGEIFEIISLIVTVNNVTKYAAKPDL